MKKKIILFTAGLILAMELSLLGGNGIMENVRSLTEAEISILVSTGAQEARIRAGELSTLEAGDLEVFRIVREEMEKRYPGESIVYLEMDVAARKGEGYGFKAYAESHGPEHPFRIFATSVVPGIPDCMAVSDGLIYQLLVPDFEAYLNALFAELELPVENFTVLLPGLANADFRRDMSAADHMAAGDFPQCSVILRLKAENISQEAFDKAAAALEDALHQDGLQGSIYLIGQEGKSPNDWENIKYRKLILL